MPRFDRDDDRGYDLDEELFFVRINEVHYLLNSAAKPLRACPDCGDENCEDEAHSGLQLVPMGELATWRALWVRTGSELVAVDTRRNNRLEREKREPGTPHFFDRTEADFPLGYVEPRHHH